MNREIKTSLINKEVKTLNVNGMLNIFKNKGMSSFDVVRRVKFLTGEKKNRTYRYFGSRSNWSITNSIGKSYKDY